MIRQKNTSLFPGEVNIGRKVSVQTIRNPQHKKTEYPIITGIFSMEKYNLYKKTGVNIKFTPEWSG
ncbi:MAG: hypothetical protein DBY39_05180 [Clostridiales bacterium]|nr:MAG: hypothetical protein DBY39_05180 [Clostridiales bacterium]